MAFFEIKGLDKSFGKSRVLRGIDFSMEKGEVVSIIGSSGSGKTTLLKCINFLYEADKGEFFFDGKKYFDAADKESLTDNQIREMRLNFGLVFQSFNLFPQYSVLKNLTLAPTLLAKADKKNYSANKAQITKDIEDRAMELLRRVGLENKSDKYPGTLSGGQQQRVAIARALMLSPKILCFDEPTSALDPELTGEVLRVIRELAEKKITMIIVTHEINFARDVSDKIVFMADGIVEEEGSPEDVLGNPKSERLKAFLANAQMK